MMEQFTPATRLWFTETFDAPTPVQIHGWERIAAGEHALLLAPTGSGKTLAAFLWSIDRLLRLAPDAPAGVRVLYISPLKALVYDIERNLRVPLAGTLRAAEKLGQPVRRVGVDMRTGDTPALDRRRQLREPADILVTTPESLFLLLGSRAAATLATVHTIILDEIHALAPTKRGVHLALSLERLQGLLPREAQRIGLSATVRPHEEVARFLAGARPVALVDQSARAHIDLKIVVPVPDMEKPPAPAPLVPPQGGPSLDQPKRPRDAGMWAAIYPMLLDTIRAHHSTIVFVNSRSLCERLSQRLNELAGEEMVRAHHGSVAPAQRAQMEEALKAGTLRAIVATSSLELGIDMGAVDLVVLVESPGSVARGLQRVGRAGHGVGELSQGIIFPKFRGDLLECTVVAERMREGALEPVVVPQNALDVLAQHLVAMCVAGPQPVAALHATIHRAYSYHSLSRAALDAVLDMLSGTYPSDAFADLRPYLSWDRAQDVVTARRGAHLVTMLNAGTIPDRGLFAVHLGEGGPRVGELDEEMVHETRKGDTFLLGATTWRVEAVTRDRVIVSPAPGEPGRMPFWHGDGPGRPVELGRAMGAFVRRIGAMSRGEAKTYLEKTAQLDAYAADNLLSYIHDQRAQTGTLPTDTAITLERFRDEIGDWRVCILSPFGARVHAPWALALEASLRQRAGFEVQSMYSDDGIVLRFANSDAPPELGQLLPEPADIEDLVMSQLANSALFASVFRENAGRALLLPRRRGEGRTPLWQQRLKAKVLLAAAQRYPSFPIVLETYRHCLRDIFDVPALVTLLQDIQRRHVIIEEVETQSASPFARSLVFAYVAAYLYEQDAPLAERKAQALTLDRDLLRELLGQAELRDLLDPGVLHDVEEELQNLAPNRQARNADALHDLLRRVGDLSVPEVAQRSVGSDSATWLTDLLAQRRAVPVLVAGTARWIVVEDVARYRDALGVMPPAGLAERFLTPVEAPLESLVRRYARTHGPFVTDAAARRFGLLPAHIEPVLKQLEATGALLHGDMRPGGSAREWCDADVLRRIKRGTLAKLRHDVAAVEATAFAGFLPCWQGLCDPRRGMAALEDAIGQLEGVALPWSALSGGILSGRIADFRMDMLDMLCATGSIVWVGQGALGSHDGRVALYRRAQAATLLDMPAAYDPPSPLHAAVLAHLARRGACFTVELTQLTAGQTAKELDAVLWDLVWAGLLTNDTVQPLKGLMLGKATRPGRVKAARPGRRPTSVVGGRWSRVSDLVDVSVTATQRAHARALMLLERYGVVSREAAAVEELSGGFASVYGVLKVMEEAGKVRRGYFVEGLSGAQFAYAGAIERLRAQRQTHADGRGSFSVVAAVDPANVYGTLLAWPMRTHEDNTTRPRRVPGAWVILSQGEPLLYVDANGHGLISFAALWSRDDGVTQAVAGLRWVAARRRGQALNIRRIDGESAHRYEHSARLQAAGMVHTFDGLSITAEAPGVPHVSQAKKILI